MCLKLSNRGMVDVENFECYDDLSCSFLWRKLKGLTLHLLTDLYFPSQTPAQQSHMINYPKNLLISPENSIFSLILSICSNEDKNKVVARWPQ